jgi:hypothetical protein
MIISGVSMESDLARMATNNSHQQIQNQVVISVLKQQMQIQEMQAAALVNMIKDTTLDGTGQMINLGI